MGDKKSPVAVGMTVLPPNQENFVDAGSTTLMNKPGEPIFKLAINLTK